MSVSDLPVKLGKPAERALAAAGIRRLDDLTAWTERDLAALHGVGPTAISKLRAALAADGRTLA
ncbi:DNA-binding protein [Nocardia ninae]|nr:DNA-binding protein [Nocardia ninae]